ncbi:MAG: hypothetical protein VKJ64_13790 [Leptolyngbyaceae bacterium]|nr:hypothetical protein [Leptolyngbyaceae bacterium]
MDFLTIALLVMMVFWSNSVLHPKKEEKKTVEEELGDVVGKALKENNFDDFGKTLGKYLKETAKNGNTQGGAVNININVDSRK